MNNKLLTVEDLFLFCKQSGLQRFSSKDAGYKLAVQIPASFEIQDTTDDPHRGMMKLKIWVFHEGKNLNGSRISHEAAVELAKTIPNRPILANIHEIGEGTDDWDFGAHDVTYYIGSDGKVEATYLEKQVGSYSEEPAFWEYDTENDKNFICAYAYIPEDYTKAASILRKKNGTYHSCELIVEEMAFNEEENCLDLIHCYLSGSTLLGRDKNGVTVMPGMQSSHADIVNFSVENNSVLNYAVLITEMKKLNSLLSDLNNNSGRKEDWDQMKKQFLIDTLAKFNKTIDDVNFDYENMTESEIEDECAKLFSVSTVEEEADTAQTDGDTAEAALESETDSEATPESEIEPAEVEPEIGSEDTSENESEVEPEAETDTFELKFELSHEDIRSQIYNALYNLDKANDYNTCYMICVVFDDYFIYTDYASNDGVFFKQSYSKTDTAVVFNGMPIEVFSEFLTAEEKSALDDMRNSYNELKSFKDDVEFQRLHSERENILNSDDYKVVSESDDWKKLVNEMDNYSLEELQNKADIIFATYVKKTGSFSRQSTDKRDEDSSSVLHFSIHSNEKNNSNSKKQEAYPGLFED